jgi:hypothetical protein
LLYFLVIPFGTYVSGIFPGLSLAFLASIFYISVTAGESGGPPTSSVLVKAAALLALAAAVGIVVKEMKSSKSRLLGMFDVLNQRTSELEKSQAQIETIYETSHTLGERLNLDEVVDEILNIVQKILGYRFFTIRLLTQENSLSLPGEIKDGEKLRYSEPRGGSLAQELREVVGSGKPIRIFDTAKDADFEPTAHGVKSFMAVPMISRGKVIGVMDAGSTRIGAFLDQDEKIFSIQLPLLQSQAGNRGDEGEEIPSALVHHHDRHRLVQKMQRHLRPPFRQPGPEGFSTKDQRLHPGSGRAVPVRGRGVCRYLTSDQKGRRPDDRREN